MGDIEFETEFEVTAIHDGSKDFYLRLSRLVPEMNVVQLRRLVTESAGRRSVPLGVRTDTVDLPWFMERAKMESIVVELLPV